MPVSVLAKTLNISRGFDLSMMARKGDISLNFIIIAILALITLIVIALFFTGGITKLFGTQQEITALSLDPQIKALAESNCKLSCTNQQESAYNSPNFPKDVIGAGFTDCEALLGKSFDSCKAIKTCQKADSASAVSCIGSTEAACNAVAGCIWK